GDLAHPGLAVDAQADEVAQQLIAAAAAVQQHAVALVAGDEVADIVIGDAVAANGVARALDFDAVAAIGYSCVAADVDADVVALHRLCAGRAVHQHAVAAVAGDDVASA